MACDYKLSPVWTLSSVVHHFKKATSHHNSFFNIIQWQKTELAFRVWIFTQNNKHSYQTVSFILLIFIALHLKMTNYSKMQATHHNTVQTGLSHLIQVHVGATLFLQSIQSFNCLRSVRISADFIMNRQKLHFSINFLHFSVDSTASPIPHTVHHHL